MAQPALKNRLQYGSVEQFRQPNLSSLARRVLDFLIPPTCLRCDAPVDEPGRVCGDCWQALHFIGAPLCACCGRPFAFDQGPDVLCGSCVADPPSFKAARAALVYDDASRPLVTRFKYGDRLEGARAFGGWIKQAAGPLIECADIIAPVPLHPWRLLARRFNQAGLIARALAREVDLPVACDLLIRTRPTRPQVGLTATGRRRNVARAFAIRPRWQGRIDGARVLLVDDVLTTGATVDACALALAAGGARDVAVVTLARVVTPLRGAI